MPKPFILALCASTVLATPVSAQMIRSQTIQAFAAPVATQGRPTLALLPARQSLYGPHNDYLYSRLQTALIQMDRFHVLERETIRTLVGEREIVEKGYAEPKEIGRLLNAQKLLIAEMTSDPTAQVRHDEKGKFCGYVSYARVTVRFIDMATGVAYDAFDVAREASDNESRSKAQDRAMDDVVSAITWAIRERSKLTARIATRNGRSVTLDIGRNQGVRSGLFFNATSETGGELGRLHVVEAADNSSRAEIVRGYYSVAPGSRAMEQTVGGFPFGIGYSNRAMVGASGLEGMTQGLDLHLNQSGLGWGAGLELGVLSHRSGISGLSGVLRLEPQLDLVPERLWLYATAGVGANVFLGVDPASSRTATSLGANALASVGLNFSPLGGLNLFSDLGYQTPWTVDSWGISQNDTVIAVVGPPTPTIGGAFARMGISCAF